MSESILKIIRAGTKVRYWYNGQYWYGEVTISRITESKVLFDGADCPLDYWYYPNKDLEVLEEEKKDD